MATSRSPEPQEPLPLSDGEQQALSDLERRLADDDPALVASLRSDAAREGASRTRVVNAAIQIGVVVTVLVVVLPATWAATLVAIVVMVVPVALSAYAARRGRT